MNNDIRLSKANKCLLCGKKRDWNSELWLVTTKNKMIFRVTICQTCRKTKKLKDVYSTIPKLLIKEKSDG